MEKALWEDLSEAVSCRIYCGLFLSPNLIRSHVLTDVMFAIA